MLPEYPTAAPRQTTTELPDYLWGRFLAFCSVFSFWLSPSESLKCAGNSSVVHGFDFSSIAAMARPNPMTAIRVEMICPADHWTVARCSCC